MCQTLPALRIYSDQLALLGVQPWTPVAVALSGGPDSVALSLLTSLWSGSEHKPHGVGRPNTAAVPKALVIDHCLRPESAAEAEQAVQTACSLGLDAVLLKAEWPQGRPSQGQLMTQARKERYRLMTDACAKLGIPCLLTGHHADDQAETFLLRLARGSGIDGLQGMKSEVPFSAGGMHGRILRPLLSLHKASLVEVCRSAGLQWVEDPTNANISYVRNKLRSVLGQIDSLQSSGQQADDSQSSRSTPNGHATPDMPGEAHQSAVRLASEGAIRSLSQDTAGDKGETVTGVLDDEEQSRTGQPGASSVTADILRLVDACREASAILTGRASAVQKAALVDAAEDWAECSLDTGPLLSAGKYVAVRTLAAILQDVSGSSQLPTHAAQLLWQRLLPERRPRAFSYGGSMECHVPGSRWPLIYVRGHRGNTASEDVPHITLKLWRKP
ncbi:probable tRNA(Ile)-lysidine synthase at N-terminal half [Coccomyxa sp. Obi]|nr:probable tRNA(Ile)-lysidine synthase at N-terminal half [Coccomyxa sp. Obi]